MGGGRGEGGRGEVRRGVRGGSEYSQLAREERERERGRERFLLVSCLPSHGDRRPSDWEYTSHGQ